jgi:hypothetical protein
MSVPVRRGAQGRPLWAAGRNDNRKAAGRNSETAGGHDNGEAAGGNDNSKAAGRNNREAAAAAENNSDAAEAEYLQAAATNTEVPHRSGRQGQAVRTVRCIIGVVVALALPFSANAQSKTPAEQKCVAFQQQVTKCKAAMGPG